MTHMEREDRILYKCLECKEKGKLKTFTRKCHLKQHCDLYHSKVI